MRTFNFRGKEIVSEQTTWLNREYLHRHINITPEYQFNKKLG